MKIICKRLTSRVIRSSISALALISLSLSLGTAAAAETAGAKVAAAQQSNPAGRSEGVSIQSHIGTTPIAGKHHPLAQEIPVDLPRHLEHQYGIKWHYSAKLAPLALPTK